MILQMKQTTKFWKIGMGTFNKYLFMFLYLWAMTTKNKQTNKQIWFFFFFFFFVQVTTVEPFLLFIPWNTKIHSAQV